MRLLKTIEPIRAPGVAATVVAAVALAAILSALAFEHLGGYAPCPLCLQERYAYYGGIPLAFAALLAARQGAPRSARLLLALAGAGFLINAGLGFYHAGVEWRFWPGPASCGTLQAIATQAGGLAQALNETRVIACDQAPWRLAGLSFAGWNAVISAGLAAVAVLGVMARAKRP